jgi:glycolate oxidase FAD binding subunit
MSGSAVETFTRSILGRWGRDRSREATPQDGFGGLQPRVVLEPDDVASLQEMLRWAHHDRQPLVVRGAGTKRGWSPGGSPAHSSADVILSTIRLDRDIDHCAGDLTVTVAAGARLSEVNDALARDRQRLALDPRCADRATIGGIVASNDSGPRRHLNGTPRDLIIGAEMVLADGRAARAGGRVVKNVAGYDLARLLCGSFGRLAVITRATFKLAPVSPASKSVAATAAAPRVLAELAREIDASPLRPSALELDMFPARLLARFESTSNATARQADAALRMCAGRGVSGALLDDDSEARVWRQYEQSLSGEEGALVKIAVLPTHVVDVIDYVERLAERLQLEWRLSGRAALGVLYVRLTPGGRSQEGTPEPDGTLASAVEELRRNAWARGGSAGVVVAPVAVKARVDASIDAGDALSLMRAIKARFDPNGILQ